MVVLALVIAVLLMFIAWRERAWAFERSELLQRIQDPVVAVQQFAKGPERKSVMPVPIDDDKAYAEARERRLNGNPD
jgi:hypothetical protein